MPESAFQAAEAPVLSEDVRKTAAGGINTPPPKTDAEPPVAPGPVQENTLSENSGRVLRAFISPGLQHIQSERPDF